MQPNKAIVGRNAFAHSSGIHQDGVLKDRQTYEIIDLQDIGLNESVIALIARRPRGACTQARTARRDLTQEELDGNLRQVPRACRQEKEIHDYDLLYLVGDIDRMKQQSVSPRQIPAGDHRHARPDGDRGAEVRRPRAHGHRHGQRPGGCRRVGDQDPDQREGRAQVEFLMQAITRGSNDVGRVHVQVQCGSRTVHGFVAHTDTTRALIEAFLRTLRVLGT